MKMMLMITMMMMIMMAMMMMMMMMMIDDENDAGKPPVSLLHRKYVSNLRTSPDLEAGTTKLLLQLFT
jgi:hypothetical protein